MAVWTVSENGLARSDSRPTGDMIQNPTSMTGRETSSSNVRKYFVNANKI
jgi:hypothetical protein